MPGLGRFVMEWQPISTAPAKCRPLNQDCLMRDKAFIIIVQVLLGIASVLVFFVSGAHATDNGQWKGYHLTPYQQNWFSTVTVPQSDLICCTIADGYPVTAEPRGDHFWINYKGHWYQVPDAAVIHDHVNPIGVPIAWLKLVGDYVTGIRCFLPADET
jgi:hypothetical protein